MGPRVVILLVACTSASAVIGCAGATAAGVPDGSTDAMVGDAPLQGDGSILSDASSPPPIIADAALLDTGAFDDVSLLPIDASPPPIPSCEAGSSFVTVDDGATVRTLTNGCVDGGPTFASPPNCGDLCTQIDIAACGGGLSLVLTMYGMPGPPVSPVADSVFEDGQGSTFRGTGTVAFRLPPSAASYGATLEGSYTQNLMTSQGQWVGAIVGTFCVVDTY
jgi:hypothetical protein